MLYKVLSLLAQRLVRSPTVFNVYPGLDIGFGCGLRCPTAKKAVLNTATKVRNLESQCQLLENALTGHVISLVR